MEFADFLRDDSVLAWFALLALLLIVVPAGSVLWRRIWRRDDAESARPSAPEARPPESGTTHFGNRVELTLLIVGLLFLLAVGSWIGGRLFG